MNEKLKLPVWAANLIWSLVATIVAGGFIGGIAWGKATTDISNLQQAQSAYKEDFKQFKQEYREDFKDFKTEVVSEIRRRL